MSKKEDFLGRNSEKANALSPSNTDDFIIYALDCSAIVAVTDTRGTIQTVNDRFVEISGYARAELIGKNHRILRSGSHDATFFRRMYRTIATGQVWHGEICNKRRNGVLYWVDTTIVPRRDSTGKITNYVSIRFDITARKLAEQDLKASRRKLQKAANTDFLTNISNRLYFTQVLRRALEADSSNHICLALLDIDTFKALNDNEGHDAGDRLLRRVAGKLETFQTPHCTVARIGGDEFAVLMTATSPETARKVIADILDAMRFNLRKGTFVHRCTVSIGYTILQKHDIKERTLLKRADLALYAAKTSGRNCAREYLPEMAERHDRSTRLRRNVQIALRDNTAFLLYQPVISLRAPWRVSLEALLYWDHATQDILAPASFPEIFEDPRLSLCLSEFVSQKIMDDLQHLLKIQTPPDRVSMNITSSDFNSPDFLVKFLSAAEAHDVPLNMLILEITESAIGHPNATDLKRKLHTLYEKNIRIALDDFGAGHASLSHMKDIAFDYVKINPGIVSGLTNSAPDAAIIRGVIDIAHSLGRLVVAEGVETQEQLRSLIEMGCDFAQGSAISKAAPIDQIPQIIQHLRATPVG